MAQSAGFLQEKRELIFWVQRKDPDAFDQASATHNQTHPSQRTYLTHDDVRNRFGPEPSLFQDLENELVNAGFDIHRQDHLLAQIWGIATVQDIQNYFNVTLKQPPEDNQVSREELLANCPMPQQMKDTIRGVFGLNDQFLCSSPHLSRNDEDTTVLGSAELRSYKPAVFADIYSFPSPPEEPDSDFKVGIISLLGAIKESDITTYFNKVIDSPPPQEIIHVGEPDGSSGTSNFEATMDLELVGALAPGCTVVMYNGKSATPKGFIDTVAKAVCDEVNRPKVITSSWAGPEHIYWNNLDQIAQMNEIMAVGSFLGMTFCICSGDAGSTVSSNSGLWSGSFAYTYFPSSSPLALGVGGTTTYIDFKNGSPVVSLEYVWNRFRFMLNMSFGSDKALSSGCASGGGVSSMNDLPDYQEGVHVPLFEKWGWKNGTLRCEKLFKGRGVPDVAANADIFTGYLIFFDDNVAVGGGTSASAPLWAALIARLNYHLGYPLGFCTDLFYELNTTFKFINRGFNGAYGALAPAQWNPCTGLGTPNGIKLLEGIQKGSA